MFRTFFWLALLATAGAFGLYFYVDSLVAAGLSSGLRPGASVIMSDTRSLDVLAQRDPDKVRALLLRRRYREIQDRPQTPGEFRLKGRVLEIFSPEYRDSSLHTHQPRFRRVELGMPNQDEIVLEPQILSALGEGEIRASRYHALEDFPPHLVRAVLTIEDSRFYSHAGIDPIGIARAMLTNLRLGRMAQGGSTITQQLAKNLFLTRRRTLGRKVLEFFAALSLERRLSKEKILEMYLNEVYLGQEGAVAIHGMGAAAHTYFAKSVADLSLDEAATLAGMIRAPISYSPRRNPKACRERRNVVLDAMRAQEVISETDYARASSVKLYVSTVKVHDRKAPHFLAHLEKELAATLGSDGGIPPGMTVYSSIDLDMQQCAEAAVRSELEFLEKTYPRLRRKKSPLEAGLVAIEPYSGRVRAWVGGRDFAKNQFDHVSQAERQVGSSIKPLLYLTALDSSLNTYRTATVLNLLSDAPLSLKQSGGKVWNPENFDEEYRGDVTVRQALEQSLNIPAIQVLERVGVQSFAQTLMKFRVSNKIPRVPALALGSLDTSLLALTASYAALANGGVWTYPRTFIAVADQESIIASRGLEEDRVADERAVFVLTDILRGVVERGTARGIRARGYTLPVAGKTGTSDEARDAWFIGFTPDLVAGVWVGFDDNSKMGLTGGAAAVPVWTNFMQCVSTFYQVEPFIMPKGVELREIDTMSGELAGPDCPRELVAKEVFVTGTEPHRVCRVHHLAPERDDLDSLRAPTLREEASSSKGSSHGFWDKILPW